MDRRPEPELMDDPVEAGAYAETDFSDVNAAFVARLLELAGPAQSARVLDLGSGPGDIPIRLASARPKWQVIGLDASAAMLGYARRAGAAAPGCTGWVLADAKQCPFAAGKFDIVCSNSILHHVSDTASLWAEIARLAKPGALVFLRDLFRPDTPEAARRLVQRYAAEASALLQEEFYRSFLAAYTPQEIAGQLRDARLRTLTVAPVTDRHVDVWGRIP